MEPLRKTPLNKVHHDLKARMMDFTGWELPVWYTSILVEHKVVRSRVGMFDVSGMGRVWLTGKWAGAFLDRVLTKPAKRLEVVLPNSASYAWRMGVFWMACGYIVWRLTSIK